MVDTQDLKSCVHKGRAGSSPASATNAPVVQRLDTSGLKSVQLWVRIPPGVQEFDNLNF